MLATMEARRAGYDEAIMLSHDGYVADGPGENIFIVKDGVLYTPPLAMSILPGITRDTVIQIAQDLGHRVEETLLIRTDLYLADEVFMVGTATEVAPVRSVDDREIGVGPVTRELQQAYLDTVEGRSERWGHWLDAVQMSPSAA
jgi:branched-chain amino acid aminotransferase